MNFEHRVRCFDFTNVPEKRPGQETGTCRVTLGPLSALRISACLAVPPACHCGASWVSVGDTARHQHLSLRILGRPWPQAGQLLMPLPLQICPRTFPRAHFSLSSCWKLWKRELKIAKMERAIWRQVFGDIFTGCEGCWHRHCLLLFGDSSELPFLIVLIFFFFRVVQLINYICFLKIFIGV